MEDRCNYCNFDCVLLTMRCAIMTFTTKVMRTQTSIKYQRAAAVVLIKIYFYDYITWLSEPCAVLLFIYLLLRQMAARHIQKQWCTFANRQHKDSSINFAETALCWIWNHEDCSRFSEILLWTFSQVRLTNQNCLNWTVFSISFHKSWNWWAVLGNKRALLQIYCTAFHGWLCLSRFAGKEWANLSSKARGPLLGLATWTWLIRAYWFNQWLLRL